MFINRIFAMKHDSTRHLTLHHGDLVPSETYNSDLNRQTVDPNTNIANIANTTIAQTVQNQYTLGTREWPLYVYCIVILASTVLLIYCLLTIINVEYLNQMAQSMSSRLNTVSNPQSSTYQYLTDSSLDGAFDNKLVTYKGTLNSMHFPETSACKVDSCLMIRRKYYSFNEQTSAFERSLNYYHEEYTEKMYNFEYCEMETNYTICSSVGHVRLLEWQIEKLVELGQATKSGTHTYISRLAEELSASNYFLTHSRGNTSTNTSNKNDCQQDCMQNDTSKYTPIKDHLYVTSQHSDPVNKRFHHRDIMLSFEVFTLACDPWDQHTASSSRSVAARESCLELSGMQYNSFVLPYFFYQSNLDQHSRGEILKDYEDKVSTIIQVQQAQSSRYVTVTNSSNSLFEKYFDLNLHNKLITFYDINAESGQENEYKNITAEITLCRFDKFKQRIRNNLLLTYCLIFVSLLLMLIAAANLVMSITPYILSSITLICYIIVLQIYTAGKAIMQYYYPLKSEEASLQSLVLILTYALSVITLFNSYYNYN